MRILISVPGLTHEYRKIRYRIFIGEEEGPEVVAARMPAQALAEALGADHVLLLIPDSLGNGASYDDIKNDAEKKSLQPFQPGSTSVHPFVLPSRYSGRMVGDIRDFYRAGILDLARWLSRHLSEDDDTIQILLETSTGLNIFQVFAYRAVKTLAGVLAFLRNVEIQVFNADPVRKESQEVEIFLTEEHRKFRATLPRWHVPSTPRLAAPYRNHDHPGQDPAYQKTRNRLKDLWPGGEAAAFLNAVHHGIPLGIVHWFHPEPEEIFSVLEEVLSYAIARLRRADTALWVRPVRLGPDVEPYALGALLSREITARWAFFTETLKDHGATYDQLCSLMKQMYRHHPVILNRFLAERSIQSDQIRCRQFPSLLANCMGGGNGCPEGRLDMRNFFAHAGFERCAVEVLRDEEGHFRFRYTEGARETIRRWLN